LVKSNLKYSVLAALLIMVVALTGYQYGFRARVRPSPASVQTQRPGHVSAPALPSSHTRLAPPLVGATYMGDNWPMNFTNAFRRENVAADFARMRQDGFNAVVLLVPWGDFQPVFDPCCTYDERAFERMDFLIDRAREAGLDVVLRIGYGWTFHPDAGDVGVRTHRLLNDVHVRQAFLAYVARGGELARKHANVRLSFLTWEDLILYSIDGDGRGDFRQFVASLPEHDPLRSLGIDANVPPQRRDAAGVTMFNAYWDWLLMQKIFKPAAERIPNLSYEARIDSEALPKRDATGKVVYEWLGHESTYRPPGADTIALYWAPFWGAENQGEQLDAKRSLHLLGALLDKVRQHRGSLPMFIDQFNVIDNTFGFEHNASLQPAALPAFMDGADCVMRKAGVFGYAYWTTRDYAESPLYNPSFSYGLDGWNLVAADGAAPESRLIKQASGDFDLRMRQGDRLRQTIPKSRGRLPTTSSDGRLSAHVCLSARSGGRAVVEVSAGAAPVRLQLGGDSSHRVCNKIPTQSRSGTELDLEIHDISGTAVLTNVMLYDRIQHGGLYKFDGEDGVLLPSMRKLNLRFAKVGTTSVSLHREPEGDSSARTHKEEPVRDGDVREPCEPRQD
jgi:hypothetical protein